MDDATRRSLTRENEAAETLAKNGYDVEQNPKVEGTTRNPDYIIEGEVFDCYSPAQNTSVRNIASTIAGRLGSWKFPFVSVKPDMLLQRPGEFEIELEKGGKLDG